MKLRWLAGALVVQSLALVALVSTWWPEGPNEETLNDLAGQYRIAEVGDRKCGDGGTAYCDWEFVIEHDGSEADLAQELARVGIEEFQIEEAATDQSRVTAFWVESDPGALSSLTGFTLFVGICVTLLTALVQLLRYLGRRLSSAWAQH